MRIHRSLRKRAQNINPAKIADKAEIYLDATAFYRHEISDVKGLVQSPKIKIKVREIDTLEREMVRIEEKLEKLAEKRAVLAARLEEDILYNLDVLADYLDKGLLKEFGS